MTLLAPTRRRDPEPPPRPSRRLVIAVNLERAWRQLTSMRTALVLLFLLALAAIPGSIIPQKDLAPAKVYAFYAHHAALAVWLNRFSLFNVFGAPWFAGIYLLLMVSLIGCLVPRIRGHARAARAQPPATPARLDRLPHVSAWHSSRSTDEVLAAAARRLRSQRWRVVNRGDSVAAEKGYLRETGNLLFHVSLLVMLAGIAVGSVFGYTGQRLLVDGHTFVNAVPLYDQYTPGALISPSDLQPFVVHLDHFLATYQPDGQPSSFLAKTTVSATPGAPAHPTNLRVNHPLRFGAATVYLLGHGYALDATLRNSRGQAVFADQVACIPKDLKTYLSECVIKMPDTGALVRDRSGALVPLQFGVLAYLAPTAAFSPGQGVVSTFPGLSRPRLVLSAFEGSLGLGGGVPQNVYSLNTAPMTQVANAILTPGAAGIAPAEPNLASLAAGAPAQGSVRLPDGFTLQISGVTNWASLEIKDDPGKDLVLAAAIAMVVGLIFSLSVRRRRLWLRATPAASGRTLVTVGGLVRSDGDGFTREFPAIAADLATPDRSRSAGPPPESDPPSQPRRTL